MAYPKWLYHRTHAPEGLFVALEEHAPSGEGWVSTPAAFDPSYVEPPPLPDGAETEFMARGGHPYMPYPAWRYHANGDAKVINTAEEDEQLDKTVWKDTPDAAAAPAPPVVAAPVTRLPDRKVKDKE